MGSAELTSSMTAIPVNIPYREAALRQLHIGVGACRLRITPGEGDQWVTGTYYGPIEALPLTITEENGEVRISQRQGWDEMFRLVEGVPTLELALGKRMPYFLTLESGASESYIELGGLPLTGLAVRQGAGKIVLDFSAPNPQQMERFFIGTGASGVEIKNLVNANFTEMTCEGGAASYKLDFGGTLTRDTRVKISAAMCSVEAFIPGTTPAKIIHHETLSGVNADSGFTTRENAFWTAAAIANPQPLLTLQVSLTMGSLNLHSR
jgi:hypothetical protein